MRALPPILALVLFAGCASDMDTPEQPAAVPDAPGGTPGAVAAAPATPTPVEASCDLPAAAAVLTTTTCDPGTVTPDAGAFTMGTVTLTGQPAAVPATLRILDEAGNLLGEATGPLPLTATLAKVPAGAFKPVAEASQTGGTVLVDGVAAFSFA
ncbi:MAG: hypothetical protein QOD77_885 [Thermoplasmata archaeon]|jgi:hypothetical protein|nr:hypothetical protein [Thermoplasmata archaeon]